MTLTIQLLNEIETFIVQHAMPPSVFGEQACGDRHVVMRLRAGRSITLRRADQLRAFMQAYRPPPRPTRRGNGARREDRAA